MLNIQTKLKFSGIFIYPLLFFCISCSGRIKLGRSDSGNTNGVTDGKSYDYTHYLSDTKMDPPLLLAWKERFIAGVASTPVISEQSVLIPFLNSEVFALRLTNGKKIGHKKFGAGPIAGLVIVGKYLLISLPQNKKSIIKYDLQRGKVLWSERSGFDITAPIINNDFIYIAAIQKKLQCLSWINGEKIWEFKTKSPVHAPPAVFQKYLVTVDRKGTIYTFLDNSEVPLWESELVNENENRFEPVYIKPVVKNGKVFISAQTGTIYALNLANGELIWKIYLHNPIYAPVSLDDTYLYIGTSGGEVYSIRQDNGTISWSFTQNNIIDKEILVMESGLLVATLKGEIIWLNKSTGELLDKIEVKGRITTAPVIADRYVIVADDKKWVYAFTVKK